MTLNKLLHELRGREIWHRDLPNEEEENRTLKCEAIIFGGYSFLFKHDDSGKSNRNDVLYQPPQILLTTTTRWHS
ncbi:hypothetical protein [Pantoea anthophila]|uniref:hypothetical protein n=1 Tax=Pantoea anthophila TaxID=470931 RepID=UPI003AFB0AE1